MKKFYPEEFSVLTHIDLDGVGCAILLNKVFGDRIKKIQYTGYGKLSQKIVKAAMFSENFILTDLSPSQEDINFMDENFKWKFLVDHHNTSNKLEIPFHRFVGTDYCATMLLFSQLSNYIGYKFSDEMKIFVELVNDYDMWLHNDPNSAALNELLCDTTPWNFVKQYKDGLTWTYDEHQRGHNLYQEKIEKIKTFETFEVEGVRVTFSEDGTTSEIPLVYPDEDFHMIVRNQKNISFRSSNKSMLDFYTFVKETYPECITCGGHKLAGGGTFAENINILDLADHFKRIMLNE